MPENVFSFANNINTIEGGTHLIGFKAALTRTINNYAAANNLFKKERVTLGGDDVREGLTAVISVKIPEPQFEGPDQDQARQFRSEGHRRGRGGRRASRNTWKRIRPSARRWSRRRSPRMPAREAARKARDLARRKTALESCVPARASWPTARRAIRGERALPGRG
jgi:DNA gyrase subunit B